MHLWLDWWGCLAPLRAACHRQATFYWMGVVLAGLSLRTDLAGVTSLLRALWLQPGVYPKLLHLFHTPALDLELLTQGWTRLVACLFQPLRVEGRWVILGDGLKAPKEGRQMPAVKKLHQESGNNSKPPFIRGHSFQALALLVQGPLGAVLAVPLVSRIHEGVVFSNRHRRTLLDKLVTLFQQVMAVLEGPALLVADAYYASAKVIRPLRAQGHHLLTRARRSATAYYPAPRPAQPRPGRPRLYGEKVRLRDLFADPEAFVAAPSPVYGEVDVTVRYRCVDLLWRPIGQLVRFVLVEHPQRGRLILMCTDLGLSPLQIITLYGYRFKIECSFKQGLRTLGTYAYHFWMRGMKPLSRRRSGDQYLHRETEAYRRQVRRKLAAYHRHVQLGCIAQGLQQYLALHRGALVWQHFRGWMRTMKPELPPSEAVVAQALRDTLDEFLVAGPADHELREFLLAHLDWERYPGMPLVA
jgi:hypothetical protein